VRAINVLIIDDDPNIRKLLLELLSGRPEYRVLVAADGKAAVKCFVEEKIDVVLTDIHMPGFTGLELMADMQKVKFKPEILVMTANATPENVETARKIGARSVILKPFDNLDVVEAEIEKAARAVGEGSGREGHGAAPQKEAAPPAAHAASARAAAPAPRPAPPAARPAAATRPAAPTPPRAAPPDAAPDDTETPDVDAWKAELVGNVTPAPTGTPGPARSARPAVAPQPAPPARPATGPAQPAAPAAAKVPPPAPARRPAPPIQAVVQPAPADTEQGLPEAEILSGEESREGGPGSEAVAELPAELDDIFGMVASLDVGKMKIQVPIVCLQTWEEKEAIAALRQKAAALAREFFTWSAARGIVKGDGQTLGEMYRDPARALEFIRRQKGSGLYVLADSRQCLEDRMVVRMLREMVMEMETARAFLVLTAPRLPVPPELQPACASFDWPAGGEADPGSLYEEVLAEVTASSGRPVRLDRASRDALLARVREMPAGRARFEIARALIALTKRAS